MSSRIPGFYKLPVSERHARLAAGTSLDAADLDAFLQGLSPDTADHMVENAVGVFGLPLGLALNFVINDQPVIVPMAVEEPSVVAACSHIAGLARRSGGFSAEADPSHMVGQVQLLDVADPEAVRARLEAQKPALLEQANTFCEGLVARGGGCFDLVVRILPPLTEGPHAELDSDRPMMVVDLLIDTKDAMGANAVNSVAEGIAPALEEVAGHRSHLRILSNLSDRRCARATMRIAFADLCKKDVPAADREGRGREIAESIVEAYRFAARDPYRACTHNKGILNGVDAVAIATGNDWRAIEAGAHAHAARGGRYTSLTWYRVLDDAGVLEAGIELPMAVGTVGGATRVHPTVAACRKLLGPFAASAASLAGLLAAVGLSQNAAALRALSTEGIQRGHMSLHARQVALAAGASGEEVDKVAQVLTAETCFRENRAREVLNDLRGNA